MEEAKALFFSFFKLRSSNFKPLDIHANFDLSLHKGIDKNYIHIDYLPGLKAGFDFFMFDFRFNILTEYINDFPNSFKSWELLALFNLIPRKDVKLFIGTGIHREKFSKQNFNEHYLGAKIGVFENKNYFDIDLRASVDYKTKAFPFFETGVRYNKRLMNVNNFFGYTTLGLVYQNYYQTHDIWSLQSGIIVNVH